MQKNFLQDIANEHEDNRQLQRTDLSHTKKDLLVILRRERLAELLRVHYSRVRVQSRVTVTVVESVKSPILITFSAEIKSHRDLVITGNLLA
jgi:hypothetical protein